MHLVTLSAQACANQPRAQTTELAWILYVRNTIGTAEDENMPMNHLNQPPGPSDGDHDDSRIIWVAAGLLAAGLFGLVLLGYSERTQYADGRFNPPVTTGQGRPVPAAPVPPR